MKTQRTYSWLLALVLLFGGVACQKRCQPPSETRVESLVDAEWRLVETTDPEVFATLDNFNFLLLRFNQNNTGQVNQVVNNDLFDNPIAQILWVADPQVELLRVRYESVPGEGSFDDPDNPGVQDLGTFDYTYSLGRQLEMRELRRGYYYRYVPFQGVVAPDIICTF